MRSAATQAEQHGTGYGYGAMAMMAHPAAGVAKVASAPDASLLLPPSTAGCSGRRRRKSPGAAGRHDGGQFSSSACQSVVAGEGLPDARR